MASARDRLNNLETEAELLDKVIALASLAGWISYHVYDSRYVHPSSTPGFPDLVLLRPPRLLFVELKRQRGKATPDQEMWLGAIDAVGEIETYTWRPADWDALEKILAPQFGPR